ncbi:hypothetical protein MFUL124B02_06550 [Myxococcus fulvus 124B02]|nr:hypothetical protein MFUL124B02_06550 [Myxococcus fulvus 124B02]
MPAVATWRHGMQRGDRWAVRRTGFASLLHRGFTGAIVHHWPFG